jgi:transposase-like protein
MDTNLTEQALRREAVQRRVQGEARRDICQALERSPRWFDKWWAEYRLHPQTAFGDRSRAPATSPQQMPAHVVQAVITARQVLEHAATPATRYGLIGARAIWGHLKQLNLRPLPSAATIQRILAEHELTHAVGAGAATAYYPWPVAWDVNAIQATDIITKHLRGGAEVQNFHTIDHYSYAVWLSPQTDKSSATTCQHLRQTWAKLGLPSIHQFDNEGNFCGGYTHPHIFGQVVRLCLFCGIEPLFTPYYDPKRNYQVESFHSLWQASFWTRHEFATCAEVRAELPTFRHWYMYHYFPPALEDQTPAQMRPGVMLRPLTPQLSAMIPDDRLPLTTGRIHFMRQVNRTGQIELLNEPWRLGAKWAGEYIRATINTRERTIAFWHQADAEAKWCLIKTRRYPVSETVHALLPEFRQNRARCRECLPG